MSNYEEFQAAPPQSENYQLQPVVTGKEMGAALNRTTEIGATSWQFLGGAPDEYGRSPANTTWFSVGPLEASPLAVTYDPDTNIRQDLHAVVCVPNQQQKHFIGIVGVAMQGEYGLLTVRLPGKNETGIEVGAGSYLDTSKDKQPTLQFGNTVVSYEPRQGIVTITSHDSARPSAVATVEQGAFMPRDTSVLGDSWALPPAALFEAADPELVEPIRDAQKRTFDYVRHEESRLRAQARHDHYYRSDQPEVVVCDPADSIHAKRVGAVVVPSPAPQPRPAETTNDEQPTLQNVYGGHQQSWGQASYLQQPPPSGYFDRRPATPASETVETQQHPYYASEASDYPV